MYPAGVGQELGVTWHVPGAAQKTVFFVFCMQLSDCLGVPTALKNKLQHETVHNMKMILSS